MTRSRLIPRLYDTVQTTTNKHCNEAVDAVIDAYQDNPVVDQRRHGTSLKEQTQQLLQHRTTLTGFYTAHCYDAHHNKRVDHVDDIFSFATNHTKKNGYVSGAITREKAILAAIPAMNFAVGAIASQNGAFTGGVMAAAALPVATCVDAINHHYVERARRADNVWDAYVERRAFDETPRPPASATTPLEDLVTTMTG